MTEPIEDGCARIFREVIPDSHPIIEGDWDNRRLLAEPLDTIDVDSLSLLDFVMQVEDAYGIELDEAAIGNCRTIGEFATLIAEERAKRGAAGT